MFESINEIFMWVGFVFFQLAVGLCIWTSWWIYKSGARSQHAWKEAIEWHDRTLALLEERKKIEQQIAAHIAHLEKNHSHPVRRIFSRYGSQPL